VDQRQPGIERRLAVAREVGAEAVAALRPAAVVDVVVRRPRPPRVALGEPVQQLEVLRAVPGDGRIFSA
jgi:hypothetical protein